MPLDTLTSYYNDKLYRQVLSDEHISNARLLVHSDRNNLHFVAGCDRKGINGPMAAAPFHAASIGKTFTATLIALLVQDGQLRFDSQLSDHLPPELLKGLFTYKGKDHSKEVQVKHLLQHRSGAADFYEDRPKQGKAFFDLLMEKPEHTWTPEATIQWTSSHLQARHAPGTKAHYSNTGYNLLGLLIERLTSMPYHEALRRRIFEPLGMEHSYLSQYETPAQSAPVGEIAHKSLKIIPEKHPSLGAIYAGGQTVNTLEDLFRFMHALSQGQVVEAGTLNEMKQWTRLSMGIQGGYGLMKIKMWPFHDRYDCWGHLGSTGSFMLYNEHADIYLIGTFNKIGYGRKSLSFLLSLLRGTSRLCR